MRTLTSIISIIALSSLTVVACDDPDTVLDQAEAVEEVELSQPAARPLAQEPVAQEDEKPAGHQTVDERAAPRQKTEWEELPEGDSAGPKGPADCCSYWAGEPGQCAKCLESTGQTCTCS